MGIILLLIQCNAPHDNPLDPDNPDYTYGYITGTVETLSAPVTPLAGVEVSWENDHVLVRTDNKGKYMIDEIAPRTGNLVFNKMGFIPDTINVTWSENKQFTANVRLNAMPVMDSLSIYTTVDYKNYVFPIIQLTVSVHIVDVDNDVDSVFVQNDHFGFKKVLVYNANTRMYEQTFYAADLNISSIKQIVGWPLVIYVVDRYAKQFNVGHGVASRVISEDISLREPVSGQLVSAKPALRWYRYNPGFDYKLVLEVYKVQVFPEQILTISDIPSDSTYYQLQTLLESGVEHWWRLWCIDSFNNRINSKFSTFQVEN